MKYPLASNTWDHNEYKSALSVLASGMFTMGQEVATFEKKYADWAGSRYAVFCNSGSSANLLALSAIKYDPRRTRNKQKNTIIVPSVSWSTTYMPIIQLGYDIEFIDVDPETFNIDVEAIAKLDPSSIAAIFAVNLLGVAADYNRLLTWCKNNDVILLEDNCESMGATLNGQKTGSFGLIGTHSTFYSHHMATMGGGICVTDDELTYEILKSLRAHGWTRNVTNKKLFFEFFDEPKSEIEENFHFVLPGYNMRPTELQGALGTQQLEKLDGFIENRRENYLYFAKRLSERDALTGQRGIGQPSWFGFGILFDPKYDRNQISERLTHYGIENRPIVSGNMLRQPVFSKTTDAKNFPNAEKIHNHGMMIGNHQFIIKEEIDYFFEVIDEILLA